MITLTLALTLDLATQRASAYEACALRQVHAHMVHSVSGVLGTVINPRHARPMHVHAGAPFSALFDEGGGPNVIEMPPPTLISFE